MVCNVAVSTAAPTVSPEVRQLWNSCRNRTVEQVIITLSTIPLELCDENSTPSDSQDPQNAQEILCEETVNDEDEDIVISEKLARAMNWEGEFAFVGEELISTGEFTAVICDGGATSTASSSFENCTDCQPKTVEIKTADNHSHMHQDILCQVKDRTYR